MASISAWNTTDKFIATMSDDSGDIISAQDNDDIIQDVKAFVKKGTLPCHTVGYRCLLYTSPSPRD